MTEVERMLDALRDAHRPPRRHLGRLPRAVRRRDDRARHPHRGAPGPRRRRGDRAASRTTARCRSCSRSAPVGDALERAADARLARRHDRSRRRSRGRVGQRGRTGAEPCLRAEPPATRSPPRRRARADDRRLVALIAALLPLLRVVAPRLLARSARRAGGARARRGIRRPALSPARCRGEPHRGRRLGRRS